jgi:hypothetical protein
MRKYIITALGKHQLTKLMPQHVQHFLNTQHASGLAPRTVQYIRTILRRALNQALRWELVSRNVATLADPPSGPSPDMQPFSTAHAQTLLAPPAATVTNISSPSYSAPACASARPSPCASQTWTWTVRSSRRHALERIRGRPWRLAVPKSESGKAAVPLIGPTAEALRAQRTRTLEPRLIASQAWQDLDFVFPTALGTPTTRPRLPPVQEAPGQSQPLVDESLGPAWVPQSGWYAGVDRMTQATGAA